MCVCECKCEQVCEREGEREKDQYTHVQRVNGVTSMCAKCRRNYFSAYSVRAMDCNRYNTDSVHMPSKSVYVCEGKKAKLGNIASS